MSAAAAKPDAFQMLLEQCAQRVLKPEFDRAAQPPQPGTAASGGKTIDLREEFRRQVDNVLIAKTAPGQ